MPTITVALYGACRDLHPEPTVAVEVDEHATVNALRQALRAQLVAAPAARRDALLGASAFASDQAVLRDADPLPADGRVAILPPVSGG
jgi:molybdopterin synthase sulfur carrier subunit